MEAGGVDGSGSRWAALFADLEAQLAAEERLDVEAEIADRTRRERALVSWTDRLAGHTGPLTLHCADRQVVSGRLLDLGQDWCVLGPPTGHEMLIPLAQVVTVAGLGRRAAAAPLARRFGLGAALRIISRDRSPVDVIDRTGRVITGTIDEVLRDAIELAEHPGDLARRAAQVRGRLLVPFSAMVVVRRRTGPR